MNKEEKQSHDTNKHESLSLSKVHDIYQYNRSVHEHLSELMSVMCHRYGWCYHSMNRKCLITSSGMAAISTVLHNILIVTKFSRDVNVIYAHELYDDVPALFKYLNSIYTNFNLHSFDIMDTKSILNLFHKDEIKNKINIFYFETCSNPSGFILDYSIIPELYSLSKQLWIIADNTWLTSAIFNPFDIISDMNANHKDNLIMIVVTSLSKYYSGGSCISGAIICDDIQFMEHIEIWIAVHGHHVSPYHCKLILRNIKQMDKRIACTSKTTMNVAKFIKGYQVKIKEDAFIMDLKYPLFEEHASYKLAQRYWSNKGYGPSVIFFKIRWKAKDEDEVWKWMKIPEDHNNGFKIEIKTSFGGSDTRFDSWPKIESDGVWIRLAIGYDDSTEDIISTVKQMFKCKMI